MSTVFANSRVGLPLAGSNGSGFTLAEESHSDHLLEPAEAERWTVVHEGGRVRHQAGCWRWAPK